MILRPSEPHARHFRPLVAFLIRIEVQALVVPGAVPGGAQHYCKPHPSHSFASERQGNEPAWSSSEVYRHDGHWHVQA